MCRLIHAHAEVHREAGEGRALYGDHGDGVFEIGECHQVVELCVGGELAVAHDVRQIGCSEHIEFSSHREVINETAHGAIEVHVGFSEGFGTRVLLGVDEQEVVGLHTDVHLHVREVGEVIVSDDIERAVVIGIEFEVLEDKPAVVDTHGVFGKAEGDAVGGAEERRLAEEHFSVDDGTAGRAMEGQLAFCRP